MGSSQSKEEVVIAQAGNGGGQTTPASVAAISTSEILSVIGFIMGMMAAILWTVRRCKKAFEKKIREEVGRSRETI